MTTASNMRITREKDGTNLMMAHNQWATRPADERFWTVKEMLDAATANKLRSIDAPLRRSQVEVVAEGEDLFVRGTTETLASLSNWSFHQLCQRAGAPSSYIAKLPAVDAAHVLNLGMQSRLFDAGSDEFDLDDDKSASSARPSRRRQQAAADETELLLFRVNEDRSMNLRAFTSTAYKRIWHRDLLIPLMGLEEHGWRTAPARPAFPDQPGTRAATEADVIRSTKMHGLQVNVGDAIAPAGLYYSDRNLFAFLINEDKPIEYKGKLFYRGFFLWNSEEGNASVGICCFLYEAVCGNHIVWNANNVYTVRMPHVGDAPAKAMHALRAPLLEYSNRAASDDAALLHKACEKILGDTRDDVIDVLGKRRSLRLSRGLIGKSIDEAESTFDVHRTDPRSVMGVVEGLTRLSQKKQNADARTELDRAAGDIMRIVF